MAVRIALRSFQKVLNVRDCGNLVRPGYIVRLVSSEEASLYNESDPGPVFFKEKTQEILKKLTGCDFDKIFRKRKLEEELATPVYKFLTNEELHEAREETKKKADKMLQMPPVLKIRNVIKTVLSRDPAITGYDKAKFIFADISPGISDRQRIVVVREPDGTLRRGSWEEQERMSEIYNPRPGRKLIKPKIFDEKNMESVLSRKEYEFLLDRACMQFEPDDPLYQTTCSLTYDEIDKNHDYAMLHSTRHYGPMCFYFAWHKRIDNMLIYLLQNHKIEESVYLIQLYQEVNKNSQSAKKNIDPEEHLDFIKFKGCGGRGSTVSFSQGTPWLN